MSAGLPPESAAEGRNPVGEGLDTREPDLGLHGEPTTHRCELCTEPLRRDEVLRHLRLFHPDRFDPSEDRPEEAA